MRFTTHKPTELHSEPGLYTHAFSAALEGRRLMVIAGQLGIRADGTIHTDFEGQFLQTYGNLRTVLASAGATFADLMSLRTYLSRADLLDEFHALRQRHYPAWFPDGNPPPNTLLVVGQLYRPDLWLEVEGMALIP